MLSHKRDEQQYKSYIENVHTLNSMKQAFKDVYPSMKEHDNGRKQKKMAGIILNYENEIKQYVDCWTQNNILYNY
jgi:cytochrome c peroxidase